MCGLNERNVKYVAQAMHDVITKYPAAEGPQVVQMWTNQRERVESVAGRNVKHDYDKVKRII